VAEIAQRLRKAAGLPKQPTGVVAKGNGAASKAKPKARAKATRA
jgi:hypothetical protein